MLPAEYEMSILPTKIHPPMKTETSSIADPQARTRASALLRSQQVIAAPTDTVYGLMCRFDSAVAIARLYALKDRPPQKAIPVLISDCQQLQLLARWPVTQLAYDLMECLWPGPLTLILPALPQLPDILTAGQQTVAVRLPDHDSLRSLIRLCGPLAATSANLSGAPETHTALEVIEQLGGRFPLVLADEENRPGCTLSSTIVDMGDPSRSEPSILREGPVADKVRQLIMRAGHS